MIKLNMDDLQLLEDCPMRETIGAVAGYIISNWSDICRADTCELEDICNEIKLLMEDAIKFNDDPTLKFNQWWNMVNPYGKYKKNS